MIKTLYIVNGYEIGIKNIENDLTIELHFGVGEFEDDFGQNKEFLYFSGILINDAFVCIDDVKTVLRCFYPKTSVKIFEKISKIAEEKGLECVV